MTPFENVKNTNIISIPQGSTYNDTVTVNQIGGAPLNLTGYAARGQVRDMNGGLVASFACTIPDPLTGVVARTIPAAETALLTPGTNIQHVWGLELTAPSGSVLPEIQGGVMISPEVVK